jgi:group I intron endonuclease
LELFPEEVNVKNNKKLIDLEDFYLKTLLPNYNILTEAGSSFGYKHTEITRIRMKAKYSEERREALGSLNRGKTLNEETKAKIREKALTRTEPRTLSKEFLDTIKKNSKGIELYNISNNTLYGEYDSILEASKSLNCSDKTIRRALKTEKKFLLRR